MRIIVPQVVEDNAPGMKLLVWRGVTGEDPCRAYPVWGWPRKAVQFVKRDGPFGGPIGIEGALDPDPSSAVFYRLTDLQNSPLAGLSSPNQLEQIAETCVLIRPMAGPGVSGVDVWLLLTNPRG